MESTKAVRPLTLHEITDYIDISIEPNPAKPGEKVKITFTPKDQLYEFILEYYWTEWEFIRLLLAVPDGNVCKIVHSSAFPIGMTRAWSTEFTAPQAEGTYGITVEFYLGKKTE